MIRILLVLCGLAILYLFQPGHFYITFVCASMNTDYCDNIDFMLSVVEINPSIRATPLMWHLA